MAALRGCRASSVSAASLMVLGVALILAMLAWVPAAQAKLPKHEDRNMLCEACNATLTELASVVGKTEKKFGRENAIAKAMDELCKDMYNFRVYAFPPPKMKKGCELIIGEYEEKIETLLYAKDPEIFTKVCSKDACKGVDISDKTKGSKMEAFVDGKPMFPEEEKDDL